MGFTSIRLLRKMQKRLLIEQTEIIPESYQPRVNVSNVSHPVYLAISIKKSRILFFLANILTRLPKRL